MQNTELVGAIRILPKTGFSASCFPYCGRHEKHEVYMSPLVMVKLEHVKKDKEITIWCRAWDASVKDHHRRDREAGVRFQVKIDT